MCTCTVLTFISWSLTGLYFITRSTCLAFRPDILDFKIVRLSIQRKNYNLSQTMHSCQFWNFSVQFLNITGIVSSLEGDEASQMKFKRIVATVFSEEGGGGERVVTTSRFPYPVLPPPVPFCPFLSWLLPFSEAEETLTQLTQSTHLHMCHSISFMTYDVSNLERFPFSPEVMLFFFLSPVRIFVFQLFLRQNFALSLGEC